MSTALASPNVSDADALAAVKLMATPPSQRPALWKERWENSAALQREFKQVEWYIGYMESVANGRSRRIIGV